MSRTTDRDAQAAPLRADALRNRERLVAAAREAFAAHGVDVPLDEVARRAGVGNATLYRHFPDREALIRQVMLHVSERFTACARTALDEQHDPFEALARVLLASVDEQVGALCAMLQDRPDCSDPEQRAARERLHAVVEELVARAQGAGLLRDDVGSGDILVGAIRLTRALPGAAVRPTTSGENLTRRHLLVFLDGLRAPGASRLPGEPPTEDDLRHCADDADAPRA